MGRTVRRALSRTVRRGRMHLRCSGLVPDVDHKPVPKVRFTHHSAWSNDDLRLAGTSGDSEHIVRHDGRRTDRQVTGELQRDVLALLRELIVGPRRQIEYHSAIAWMIAHPDQYCR